MCRAIQDEIEQFGTVPMVQNPMETPELDDRARPIAKMIKVSKANAIDTCGDAIAPLAPNQPADVEQDI